MTVTSVDKNYDDLTLTLIADFSATIERVWELWSDPRQLERWWGPPTYPATFEDYELVADGIVNYYMTSPEGEKFHGWWRVVSATPPQSLELLDGFADETGAPSDDMPVTSMRVELTEAGGATRMQLNSTFASREGMERLIEMGMAEGLTLAVGQIDDLLAASPSRQEA